jgi:hypothetical protein
MYADYNSRQSENGCCKMIDAVISVQKKGYVGYAKTFSNNLS